MRLINTETMEMVEFIGSTTPKYAILSQRWSDGAEVTYMYYMDGNALSMPAYDKVLSFCSKAGSEGLQYAWIDTCCIDKRSSAELSESINSMFKWYQQAEICYAYLNDVTKDGTDFFANKDRVFETGRDIDTHPNDIWQKQRQDCTCNFAIAFGSSDDGHCKNWLRLPRSCSLIVTGMIWERSIH